MDKKLLFLVEFGEPQVGFAFNFGNQSPIYVVAKDYNEAAEKALAYVEYKKITAPKKNILTRDGSLNKSEDFADDEVKIRAIKLASEDVVW